MPRLNLAHATPKAQGVANMGPFGETIANTHVRRKCAPVSPDARGDRHPDGKNTCRLGASAGALGLLGDAAREEWLSSRLLPAPSAVAAAFWQTLRDGSLIENTLVSTGRALKGLFIGGIIGFVFGIINGLWKPAELLLDSSLQMLRNVPHLAIIPLVILWFGSLKNPKSS